MFFDWAFAPEADLRQGPRAGGVTDLGITGSRLQSAPPAGRVDSTPGVVFDSI